MSYLRDTCVLSELCKPAPDPNVVAWINDVDESNLFLSVITFREIQKGIAKLDESKRKRSLQLWLEQSLPRRFASRTPPIDGEVPLEWGALQGGLERFGNPVPVIYSLIAATAICHNLTLVTRNTADFKRIPVKLLNPWLSTG